MEKLETACLEAAQKSISSTLRKNEKVYITLSQKEVLRISQLKLVSDNIKNFRLMLKLVEDKLANINAPLVPKEELALLCKAVPLYIEQIEKVKPKFKQGTPQFTLAIRRIEAYKLVLSIIEETHV